MILTLRGPKTYGSGNSLIWCMGSCRPNLEHSQYFKNCPITLNVSPECPDRLKRSVTIRLYVTIQVCVSIRGTTIWRLYSKLI